MARNWVRLPSYSSKEEAERYVPPGWEVFQIEDLYDQLPVGKRFEQKTSFPIGTVPVIDQSESGIVGYHNEDPGVTASPENPVVTFANHTCEMRMMTEPFSVIQNVFPLIGRAGVCRTKFFYYLTKGRVWLEEYKGHFPEFRRKWVCCPPEVEQERLEKILCSFDSKIDLNRRINQTLEAMAQAVFKSWFVDFDPVKAKIAAIEQGEDPLRAAMCAISGLSACGAQAGKTDAELDQMPREHHDQLAATAALFPDAMEESELGAVPLGWTPTPIRDVAEVVKGKSYSSKDLVDNNQTALVTLKSFERGGGFRMDGFKPYVGPYKPEQVVLPGDLIVAYTDVTQAAELIGKPAVVVGVDHFKTLVASLDVGIVRPLNERVSRQFLYGLFMTDAFQSHTFAHTSGTTVLHLAKEGVPSYLFACPDKQLIRFFSETAEAMAMEKQRLLDQNRSLATLRDTLLPKLLSGELSVVDLDKEVAVS